MVIGPRGRPERRRLPRSSDDGPATGPGAKSAHDRWGGPLRRPHSRGRGQLGRVYRDEGYDAYILRLLKDVYYPDWIEAHLDYADRLREEERKKDLRGVLQWGVAIRSFDVRAHLGKIRTPTLIVQGIDDRRRGPFACTHPPPVDTGF